MEQLADGVLTRHVDLEKQDGTGALARSSILISQYLLEYQGVRHKLATKL
jgi:hypothetical protein